MSEYYETGEYPPGIIDKFVEMFDERVGTDREVNDSASGDGSQYVICCDLELLSEIVECKKIENEAKELWKSQK